jgi:hypothetical protein
MQNGEVRYEVVLTGRTPLLMHYDNIELELEEHLKGKERAGKAGDDRFPPDRWKRYLYIDDTKKGHIVLPAENISAMLREAGKKLKAGRGSLKAASQADIWIEEDFPKLLVKGKPLPAKKIAGIKGDFAEQYHAAKKLNFRLFAKRVVVQGNRHVRVRPRFDDWKVKLTVLCSHEDITKDQFASLWEIGGRKIGLCDWRPGSKQPGRYGMFTVSIKKKRK